MGNTLQKLQSQQGQQGQQGQQSQQGQKYSSLNKILIEWYFIERFIRANRLLNKFFPHCSRICQAGDYHQYIQFSRSRSVIFHRIDLLKLVGANMNVLLTLRLVSMHKGKSSMNDGLLHKMAKIILSRQTRQNRDQADQAEIVVLPEEGLCVCVPTNMPHPTLPLTARMSFNNTKVFLEDQTGKVAKCISILPQKHFPCINCGLEWHQTKPILGVVNYSDRKFNIYKVSLEDRSVECISTIPVQGVVFAILPHQNSFILISKDTDPNMMKIWRICLETMSTKCIATLLNSVYTMNIFSILPNQMIIADVSNDGLLLTISNPSGQLMRLTFNVECYGLNRISSILFLDHDIIAIGTDCGKIKLFRLSPDYSSAKCFALLQEPSDIFPSGGSITYSIRIMTVHPSDPSIFAVLVKTYSVKIFKWLSDRIIVLAEINIKNEIRSITFSNDGYLLIGCFDGSSLRW